MAGNTFLSDRGTRAFYSFCDLLFAGALGSFMAFIVPLLLGQSLPMVFRMALAMTVGMVLAMMLSIVAAIPLGMFETMTYGMWTGMIGAMLGVMDTGGGWARLRTGLLSGVAVWLFFSLLNSYYRSKGAELRSFVKESSRRRTRNKQRKETTVWDRLAGLYDFMLWGSERRQRNLKKQTFSKASGRVLFVGAGTGTDLLLMPPSINLFALDVSQKMLAKAKKRAKEYDRTVYFIRSDIQRSPFPASSFDTVVSSCVFCSVPDPVLGLTEIKRMLKPGGRLIMFEHVLSRNPLLSPMLRAMNPLSAGPDLTRDTVGNVLRSGLGPVTHKNVYMDIVKVIEVDKAA